jgi:hypothetical protein
MRKLIGVFLVILLGLTSCSPNDVVDLWAANIWPGKNNYYNLGNPTHYWKNVYTSALTMNGTTITEIANLTGPQGIQGVPGPNVINSTTNTTFTGILAGNGTKVNAIPDNSTNWDTAYSHSVENKTYGEVYLSETGLAKANSVSVVDGTITAGDVAKTYYANKDYLTIRETGVFKVNVTFTNVTYDPYKITIVARYNGDSSHEIEARIYNYTSSAFDNLVATVKDFPSQENTTDTLYQFLYPTNSTNYRSGNNVIFRFDHTSTEFVTSHYLYIDQIELKVATLQLPTAGTFYSLSGLAVGQLSGVTANATALVISKSGVYSIDETASWGGTPSAVYYAHVFVNGVAIENFGVRKRLNTNGDMMTSGMSGMLNLNAGDVMTIRFTSDNNNSCMAIQYLNLRVVMN